jgi:hypothetical protein
MRITKVRTTRYLTNEIEKLDIALDLFSQSVNSIEFKQLIEDHEPFETKDQHSNDTIYTIIMNGNEVDTNQGIDHEADLNLTLDLRNSTDAIGFTKQERIFTFQNFFHQLQPTKLAGHYAHEYCHTLGFADPDELSDITKNVPYEVGRIIEEIAINNHRTFTLFDENMSDNERAAAMHTFRNATILTGDADAAEATTARRAVPGNAKIRVKKSAPVKKTARKKASVKKKKAKPAKKKIAVVKKKKVAKKKTLKRK